MTGCAARGSEDPVGGATLLDALTSPVITTTGSRILGTRFTDQRAHALLGACCALACHHNSVTPATPAAS